MVHFGLLVQFWYRWDRSDHHVLIDRLQVFFLVVDVRISPDKDLFGVAHKCGGLLRGYDALLRQILQISGPAVPEAVQSHGRNHVHVLISTCSFVDRPQDALRQASVRPFIDQLAVLPGE